MLELRPFQKQALDALSTPGNVLCVAPTGSGKSLIYERAAQKPGRRTLLITPLIALGRQQQARLSEACDMSTIRIMSPERLTIPTQLEAIRRWKPDFLVVDECHCLWEWGEGFRPAFQKVPELIVSEKIPSSLWLTATLPIEAREELRLKVPGPMRELGAFDLPPSLELNLARIRWADRAEVMLGWLRQQSGPGIIFVSTRESAQRLARLIEATGKSVQFYHAGMSSEERRISEACISQQMPDVIVATSAFGMGMDYPWLEWVLLWQAPPSLLAFAQAIGRVGRGAGRTARALALWDDDDFRLLEWTTHGSERRKRQLQLTYDYLHSGRCRRAGLRSYFSHGLVTAPETDTQCGRCDFCRVT